LQERKLKEFNLLNSTKSYNEGKRWRQTSYTNRGNHGTIEEVTSKIKEYKRLGVSHFIFMFPETMKLNK